MPEGHKEGLDGIHECFKGGKGSRRCERGGLRHGKHSDLGDGGLGRSEGGGEGGRLAWWEGGGLQQGGSGELQCGKGRGLL